MGLLILYATLALAASFLCSVLEAVLLSVTPSYVGALEKRRPRSGARLARLKESVDKPLAAILSLNTVAHTIGAAGVGAQAQIVFGSTSVAIASVILTVLILVVSEIIPKTIGATHWKRLAPALPYVLAPLLWALYPLVVLSRALTRLLTRRQAESRVDRDEFAALTDLACEEGVLDRNETSVLRNLMHFRELRAADVMTPRTVMMAFDEASTVAAVTEDERLPFSRVPVFRDQIDHITGYVLKQDLLLALSRGEGERKLVELKREIVAVRQATRLTLVLDTMLRHREHLVLLVDDFGGCAGIVTMEDVVETLLGIEIVDETDQAEDMQALARQRWERRRHARSVWLDDTADRDREEDGPLPSAALPSNA